MTATRPASIHTSYFAKAIKQHNAVSIAQITPHWAPKGLPTYKAVAPYVDMLRMPLEQYHPRYLKILAGLDPRQIITDLAGKILLCYEGPDKYCHRHTLAKWLYDTEGFVVTEWKAAPQAYQTGPAEWWDASKPDVVHTSPPLPLPTPAGLQAQQHLGLF